MEPKHMNLEEPIKSYLHLPPLLPTYMPSGSFSAKLLLSPRPQRPISIQYTSFLTTSSMALSACLCFKNAGAKRTANPEGFYFENVVKLSFNETKHLVQRCEFN